MIEIPIVKDPEIFESLLSQFSEAFNNTRQFEQFRKLITSMATSSSGSVAHLNGIHIDHTDQSNLNRFVSSNYDPNAIFKKQCELINSVEKDGILVIDDTIIEKTGKNIAMTGWFFDHSKGKQVFGLQLATSTYSGSYGIYPLIITPYIKNNNREKYRSKIEIQKEHIKSCVDNNLKFSTVVMDSWYFSNELVQYIESLGKSWVAETKLNRLIYVNDEWITIEELVAGIKIREMRSYKINGKTYLIGSYIVNMKGIGAVNLVISLGEGMTKVIVSNRLDWKAKKVIEKYLRRWDIEVMHREIKQNGLRKFLLRRECGITRYMVLNSLAVSLLEISTVKTLPNTHLEFRSVTPEVRYRWIAIEVLENLLKSIERYGMGIFELIKRSISNPYKSTMVSKT